MPAQPPNVLFILTDQQRRDTMRCYGNDWIETPNLDRIADSGFVFENAYVTQPVCTPARGSIMTGLYPQTTGLIKNAIELSPDIQTIAELVSDDYICAHYGKWHLGNDAFPQHGFEDWISIEDHHRAGFQRREQRHREADYNLWLREQGIDNPPVSPISYEKWLPGADLPEELTQAAYLGNEATRFLREHDGRPFVLYVSFFEPHPPYTGPLNGLYDPDTLPVGPAFLQRPDGGSLVNRARADYYMGGNLNPLGAEGGDIHDLTTEAGWRRLRAQYFANVTLVDRNVGRILDALDANDYTDNTIVVMSSEHGEMGGDHGMLEKRSLYEEASRVPLLMSVPWLNSGQTRIGGSVSQIDLVPTLLDLLDQPVPDHLQGASLAPVLKETIAKPPLPAGEGWGEGETRVGSSPMNPQFPGKSGVTQRSLKGRTTLDDNDVFLQWNGMGDRNLGSPLINRMVSLPWRSVITADRWKLNLCAGDQCELYDLNTDPFELNNLFDDPSQRDRIREMAARVRIWQNETGDHAPIPTV